MSASLSSTFADPSPPVGTSLVESTVVPALFLLVPLFTFALFVLALYNRPRAPKGNTKLQGRVAYAIIGTLAVVSTLVGALPLGHSRTPQVTAVLQALLSFLLGLPVLHLASSYAPSKANRVLQLLQGSILVILLSTATLLALLAPFLPSLSAVYPRYLPSTLFLAYSVLALPRIAVTLFRFLQPSSDPTLKATSISNSSIKFLLPSRRRERPTRRPITIHVETHRSSIPLSLPSPASSVASLPLSDPHNEPENSIELEITFPNGKDSRSRLNEDSTQAPYPYQDEKKSRPESSSPKDEKHYSTKHDKTSSVDSTISTTTGFNPSRTRYRSRTPPLTCLPSSLPLISLGSPPRPAYTAAFTADPDPPPFTNYAFQQEEGEIYRFPRTEGGSNENREEANNSIEINSRTAHQRLIYSRLRNLLVFLFAAQFTLLVGYVCGVAAAVATPQISTSVSNSAIASLKTVQAACTVLAIIGTMSAYLLHAHNSHASPACRGQHTGAGHRPSRFGPSPIQTIDTTSNGHTYPVVIHLAPPPPPRTRRHRVDALGTVAAPAGLLGLPSSKVNRYSSSESNDSYGAHTAPTSNSDHSAFSDAQMNHGSGHILHDVSHTYPHATQENEQPSHHNQPHSHQPHHQNPQFYSMPRNPITLTYEPPKLRRSLSGRSLIETTETEEEVDLELELEDDQDVNSNVDLESEMHRALSRTSSMASSAVSGAGNIGRARTKVGLTKAKAAAPRPNSKPSKAKGKKTAEDPAMYIHKRGSLPPVSASKKFFGWEFGWDPLPKQRSRGSGEMKEVQDTSFLDFRGVRRKDSDKVKDKDVKVPMTPTKKLKRYSTPAGAMHHRTMSGREAAKMEKLEDLLGIGVGLTSMDSTTSETSKKLKKRSKSVTRSDEAGVSEQQPLVPDQLVRSTPQSTALTSGLEHRKVKSTSTSASSGGATSRPGTADSKTSSNRGHRSSASFGTRSSMRRDGFGLQLKKSFKLGVGRTLGPNLTLASAGLAYGRSDETNWRARKASGRDSLGDQERSVDTQEEDDDVHSVAAAKLVSASIARVMPAATILTAPSSPTTRSPIAQSTVFQSSLVSPSGVAYRPPGPATRPALPSIITSLPIPISVVKAAPSSAPGFTSASSHVYSPQNSKAPRTSGSTWRSHPLTNPADESAHPLVRTLVTIAPIELGTSSPEDDDVVQLEREMEESQRQSGDVRGDGGLDSPSALFKEQAAFAGGLPDDVSVSASPPEPLTNASLTPSLNSIFAHAHAQAQTAALLSLPTTTQKAAATPEKIKGGLFGRGHTQKRMPLSAPPVTSKMEWGPQSSGIDANTGSSSAGLPYKFPLIFPHSFSNSSSPPGSNSVGYTNQQPQSTPSTPKGVSSTLRLSSMTMGTVRNVFAGVGARMSSATIRMSINGAPAVNGSRKSKAEPGHGFGEMVMDAGEGDFMDLRDPFAPPPPSGRNKVDEEIERLWEIDSGLVHGPGGLNVPGDQAGVTGPRRRMSSWGKLPIPARPISPALSAVNGNVSGASTKKTIIGSAHRAARIVGKPSRKHKKSRRSAMLSSANGGIKPGEEDEDFGLEEALLSQRLLNHLDADGWEVQT